MNTILGSHRHGALGTALLGSVSLELLRRARCPVLVVHPTPAPVPVG
jgi:nucleotide-binding universal stress UspA family protein